jgi:transposase
MKRVEVRKLKPTERKKISRILRRKGDSKVAERARMINLANQGYTAPQIAEILQLHVKTIRRWIKRFNEHGIEALYDLPRSGRPDKKSKLSETVYQVAISKPSTFGKAFSYWTVETLRDQVEAQTSESVSAATITRILQERGWRYGRLKTMYESNAPSKEEKKTLSQNSKKDIRTTQKTQS